MKKLLAVLTVCVALAVTSLDAEAARRFGGGSSFGRSAPTFSQKAPAPATNPSVAPHQAASPNRAAQGANQVGRPAPAPRPSMMRSVLTGIAAALGISALLSLLGVNSAGMASFITGLLLVVVLFLAVRFFLSRRKASTETVGGTAAYSGEAEKNAYSYQREEVSPSPASAPQASQPEANANVVGARPGSVMDQFLRGREAPATAEAAIDVTPVDFDTEGFLRTARDNFIKLQSAWDTGNVMTISDFTTNDLFIAVTHQLRERGNVPYKTEILSLTNELLGIARDGGEYVASVRFLSKLRINGEEENADETWVLVKPVEGEGGWLLAGIKQNEEGAAHA